MQNLIRFTQKTHKLKKNLRMKKKLISFFNLSLLAIIFMQVIIAQEQSDYHKQIDQIFEIPAGKIPSGILIDRSPEILNMNGYNPTSKPIIDTCHLFEWMCIYYRLYASYLNKDEFKYDLNVAGQYHSIFKPEMDKIPLGIIYFDYDKLKKNAVERRLWQVDTLNQKVRDLSGVGTPTEAATCFAFSPMADTIPSGTHKFYIDPTLFVSNKTSMFNELYIDFDDGRGFVKVLLNETVSVSYYELGNKTLILKAILEKETLLAYAGLYVSENKIVLAPPVPVPVPDYGPKTYTNSGIDAVYGIWYRCNHNNKIHKPLLIVSGFDPENKNRIGNEKPEGVEKVYLYNVANKNGFLDKLREFGYDIIIYRSDNSTKSIISNAMNLVNFIKTKVNDVKISDNELIVIGVSMGGLVCRYALTYMEQTSNTYDHKTKLFISMDSPQNGANVPLGFQYLVKYLNMDVDGKIEKLKKVMDDMLDSDAAKEMLLYHHTNTSNLTARCATNRTTFLNSLSSIGNFPKKCQTMALSMGSGVGTNQGFSPGSTLLKKQTSDIVPSIYFGLDNILWLLGIPSIGGFILSQFAWEIEVNAVPNQTKSVVYKEDLYLKLFGPKVISTPDGPKIVSVSTPLPTPIQRKEEVNNTQPIDNAPGSTIGLHNLKTVDLKGMDKILSDLGILVVDNHYDCFIPSYSALGLNVTPQTNIKSYMNSASGVTKINDNLYYNTNKSVSFFDYLYIENKNLDHVYDDNKVSVLTPEMLVALDNMISSKKLFLENKTIISGQSVAYEAAESITASNNYFVESGGKAEMKAPKINLKPNFHAKKGSTVHLKTDDSWICPPGTIKSVSLFPLSELSWEEGQTTPTSCQNNNSEEEIIQTMEQKMENRITLFPNPVENILNLKIENRVEGEMKITIVDFKGQIVYSQMIMNDLDNAINCSQFISGVYFVIIESKDCTQTFKIIKK